MNYYESSANNTADSISPSVCTRLTGDIADGTLKKLRLTARRLPPVPLREHNQWVCWKYKQRGNQTTKPPIDPHTGNYASVDDPSTWANYETALRHYQQENVDGIGFVLTEDDPFAGIDWDDCREATTGTIDEWVRDELDEIDSYSEVSPSGNGLHTYVYGTLPDTGGNQNKEQGIEVYESGQYLTISGDHYQYTPLTINNREGKLRDLYESYIGESASGSRAVGQQSIPDVNSVDETDVEHAKALLRDFYNDTETTGRARDYLTDLLKGRYKTREFIADNGTADRSEAESVLATLLYGIFQQGEDADRSLELVDAYVTYACKKNRWTADGQPRKWLLSEAHRRTALQNASKNFDRGFLKRWQRKKESWDTWSDDYSEPTYERVLEAVFALADPETKEYPTKRDVIEFAQEMDPSRAKRTHESALHKLRDDREHIKMAYLGGNEYVYYPVDLPDPAGVEWVKIGGEKDPSSSA